MNRIRRQVALLGLLSLVARPAPAQPARSHPPETTEQFIDVDGRTLHIRVGGSGTPTVVLDSGLGDSLAPWNDIFPAIAGFTRVVAYDRAGYGRSDPGPEPRSYVGVATELHKLLTRAGFAPPYVLVGHSLGGAHIRAFAHLFKDDVAGLVFVDPMSEGMFAAVSSEERTKDREEQDAAASKGPPGVRGEWAFSREESLHDFPQLRSLGTPPDVPMAVLVASRGRPRLWVRSLLSQYGQWIADASEGYLLVTADSGHYIQRDEPALVISAIRRVVFPSAEKALARIVEEKGALAAVATYRDMKARYPAEYLQEGILNRLGYERLQAGHVDDAVAIFKLNVEMYSDGFNTYDSLAEAYMAKGDRQAAIEHYRKSLALNPDNGNARLMLKRLEDGLPR